MGTKKTFTNITADYTSKDLINTLFDELEAELDKCLYLDGTAPNAMSADLDLGGNDILNGGDAAFTDVTVGGSSIAASAAAAAAAQVAAEAAQTAAEAAQTSAESAYDSFDDRYLGAKSSDPSLDNDGDALVAGALYFNTTTSTMKAYTGSAWGDISVPTTFLSLTDTPSSLSGESLKYVRVNAGETALEFTASAATVGDGDYGDVTVSGSGTVWTVDDGLAVSNANLTTPTITTSVTFDSLTMTGITGADLEFVSGTAGTANNFVMWNADGDAVDSTISFIDEDSMATDSAVKVPSQQSVKAYVDAQVAAGSDTFGSALLHLQDVQSSGSDGGTFTSGAWRTRTLNTEVTDEIGSTLAANQFTLPDGTYWIEAEAPAIDAGNHKVALYNVTDAAYELYGSSARSGDSNTAMCSYLRGRFTVAGGPDTFEFRHRCTVSKSTVGFGQATGISAVSERYADVRIWKIG